MNTLWLLLVPIIGFLGSVFLAGSAKKYPAVMKSWALIVSVALIPLSILTFSSIGTVIPGPVVFGSPLLLGLTELSWYFVLMIVGITVLTIFFSVGALRSMEDFPLYYGWLFLKVMGMIAVVLSRDLLSFFIAWEMMSWATFFLMRQGDERVQRSSLGYLVYAVVAGMILLAGTLYIRNALGTLSFAELSQRFAGADVGILVVTVILMLLPMLIEAAVYPFHSWLPDAYASTETSITAYLASISTRIGIYALTIFLFAILGIQVVDRLGVSSHWNLRMVLLVLAALTAVLPTFTALFQHDAKQLVTWHSIGQGGYMLLGLASASALGTAGGLFHVFNHLTYVSLIIFSIAAVEYRTGTTNLNKLGGLITKQPVAFLGMLFGIIGLAGIPPMNGFVSKWLIYRSLILGGYPFIALCAFLATIGTILSVYKLIHNTFLGQLRQEYEGIKEVGFWMQVPIWILMAVVLVTGVFPGLILQWIARIQASLGLEVLAYNLGGVSPGEGNLNMIAVIILFLATFVVAWLLFLTGSRRRIVSQYDNYAGGHFLNKTVPYNFNYNFYSAFDHIFEKQYQKAPVKKIERNFGRFISSMADYTRRIFTGQINTYAAYGLIAMLVVLIVLGEVL